MFVVVDAWLRRSLAILSVVVLCLHVTEADITNTVVCEPEFAWMNNHRGQSICLVGAYVQGVCNGNDFNYSPLAVNTHYTPPTGDPNLCTCSTVVYNLVSACGACQGRLYINWSEWSLNCSSSEITYGGFPLPLPAGTAVPAWAYTDPRQVGDTLNLTVAQTLLAEPESTLVLPSSTSSTSTSSSTTSSMTTTSPAPDTSSTDHSSQAPPTNSSGGSSTPVGPIVGGVLGGLAVGGLLGAVIYFIHKRRTERSTPSPLTIAPQYSGPPGHIKTTGSPFLPADQYNTTPLLLHTASSPVTSHSQAYSTSSGSPMPYNVSSLHSGSPVPYPAPSPPVQQPLRYQQPVLYNPDDPSTFPTRTFSPAPTYVTSYNPAGGPHV